MAAGILAPLLRSRIDHGSPACLSDVPACGHVYFYKVWNQKDALVGKGSPCPTVHDDLMHGREMCMYTRLTRLLGPLESITGLKLIGIDCATDRNSWGNISVP